MPAVSGYWQESNRRRDLRSAAARAMMIGIVLLSAALVWHDLGAREVLGRDENATIIKLDQPDLQAVLAVTGMRITGGPPGLHVDRCGRPGPAW